MPTNKGKPPAKAEVEKAKSPEKRKVDFQLSDEEIERVSGGVRKSSAEMTCGSPKV